jgi:glycosyltransferase involved in cell wall biosynthesis
MLSDEMPTPLFSVVITTYNRAALLTRALRSLIAQTENNWEAIVIDDGSTDDTRYKILPYLREGRRIRYVYQSSSGSTYAKNRGIFLSSGKYVTFLDSDDEYDSLHLETRKQILLSNPSIDFLYGGVRITGDPYVPDRYNYNKKVHLADCVVGGSFFIRREVAVAMNGFTEMPLGSDADLFERINKTHAIVAKSTAATYIYHRETSNSITNNLAGCLKLPGFLPV